MRAKQNKSYENMVTFVLVCENVFFFSQNQTGLTQRFLPTAFQIAKALLL